MITKENLATEYNKVVDQLSVIGKEYEALGLEFPYYFTKIFSVNTWTKKDLEDALYHLKAHLENSKSELKDIKKNIEFEKTEEGKEYIESLKDLEIDELDKLSDLQNEFIDSFNAFIAAIGLKGWKICKNYENFLENVVSSLPFSIVNDRCEIRLQFRYNFKVRKYEILINTSMYGSEEISNHKSNQYQQFKAYITICDNCEMVNFWMENKYEDIIKRYRSINDKIEEIVLMQENPYKFYEMRNCETTK